MLRGAREIALLAVLAAMASAEDTPAPTTPTVAPAPTEPPATNNPTNTPPPPATPTATSPTPVPSETNPASTGLLPAANAVTIETTLTVRLGELCESGRIDTTETELAVTCEDSSDFTTKTLTPLLRIVIADYTERFTLGRLTYPALSLVDVASKAGSVPSVELLTTSLSSLEQLNSLSFSRIDLADQFVSLKVAASLTTLKMNGTNAMDVSLTYTSTIEPLLTTIEFSSNRFTQLPLVLYERDYGRQLTVTADLSFSGGVTDLSAIEYANAKANLGTNLDKLISFADKCPRADSFSAAHVVCLNPERFGIRSIAERRTETVTSTTPSGSGSSDDTTTQVPTRSSSSSDTTLTIVVIVIAVVAAILAYFVARRYFCTSSSTNGSPRHNDRTVGLISKEESQAAYGKPSFISGDDTLRQIRLEQQDVSIGKSMGTGFLWSGDYQGRKVIIKRVEAESNDSRVTKALISQARSLVPVVHPNLTKLMGVTWIQGTDFGIVAEFMEKGTLKLVLMDIDTELDLHSKLHMCLDIAHGLAYLHSAEHNMYMRALSSRKVLVNGAIECKLNVFECHPTTTKVEVPDVFGAGDMAWWAPELVLHKAALDPRKINIFSLGVLICEIITRVSPYQSVVDEKGHTLADIDLMQTIRRHERLQPHENRREFTELPAALREIVGRCLSYQPHMRPTADEVVQCLEAVKDHSERMGSTTSL